MNKSYNYVEFMHSHIIVYRQRPRVQAMARGKYIYIYIFVTRSIEIALYKEASTNEIKVYKITINIKLIL